MARALARIRAFERVNPLVPAATALLGVLVFGFGYRWIGAGFALGGILAFVNALFLSARVDVAAEAGDAGRAMLVMQVGLLLTFAIVAIATVIMIRISLPLTLGAVAGFAATHLGILGTFYAFKARSAKAEGEPL